jgi:hypothetical protein
VADSECVPRGARFVYPDLFGFIVTGRGFRALVFRELDPRAESMGRRLLSLVYIGFWDIVCSGARGFWDVDSVGFGPNRVGGGLLMGTHVVGVFLGAVGSWGRSGLLLRVQDLSSERIARGLSFCSIATIVGRVLGGRGRLVTGLVFHLDPERVAGALLVGRGGRFPRVVRSWGRSLEGFGFLITGGHERGARPVLPRVGHSVH